MAAIGDISAFKSGRELAAWLGLVPRQHSTGGRSTLKGISKRGDSYLRTLLIHGGCTVVRVADKYQDRKNRWISGVDQRRGKNIAAVAVANKNARIAWALLSTGGQEDHVSGGSRVKGVTRPVLNRGATCIGAVGLLLACGQESG